MRSFAGLATALSVVCIFVVGPAKADEAAAMGRIEAAKTALSEGKGEAAAAAFEELAGIVTADAAGAGDFAVAMADLQADTARRMARNAKKSAAPDDTETAIALMRAEGFYGVLIPVGRGDLAAASKWLKENDQKCPPAAKGRFAEAARVLGEAAREQAQKKDVLALAQVTVGLTLPLGKAAGLVEEGKYSLAGLWVTAAVEYVEEEEKLAGEIGAEDIADLVMEMKAVARDLANGFPVGAAEITALQESAESTILATYRLPSFEE